jgi:hypothetical protein
MDLRRLSDRALQRYITFLLRLLDRAYGESRLRNQT